MDLTAKRRRLEAAGCTIRLDATGPPPSPSCCITLPDGRLIHRGGATIEKAMAAACAQAEAELGARLNGRGEG